MKLILSAFAALALSACASLGLGSDPQAQWDKSQGVYNTLAATAVALRAPCVEIGSDDPGCILTDERWTRFRAAQKTADGYLQAADAQIQAGETDAARFYLRNAAAAIAALAGHVGAPPPELED